MSNASSHAPPSGFRHQKETNPSSAVGGISDQRFIYEQNLAKAQAESHHHTVNESIISPSDAATNRSQLLSQSMTHPFSAHGGRDSKA